jgi:Icc-related predicted phosphoesterase
MKIQLYSDLHIEFDSFEAVCDKADVVVFAGDIEVGVKGIRWLDTLGMDKPIIYVLGNHEYYKNTYPELVSKARDEVVGKNIHLLENESITIEGINFHGCTLWTDFKLFGDPRIAGYECQQVLTDFKKIRRSNGYSKLRALDVSLIHQRSRDWLSDSLRKSSGPNVVVTHHAPSLRSAPEKYKKDIVTSAYASNMEAFIAEHEPDIWLHGHMHNSSDYMIDGCRVVCNPRGYKDEFNANFEYEKLIDIG